MATETAPRATERRLDAPEVTIVIPLLNEQATIDGSGTASTAPWAAPASPPR